MEEEKNTKKPYKKYPRRHYNHPKKAEHPTDGTQLPENSVTAEEKPYEKPITEQKPRQDHRNQNHHQRSEGNEPSAMPQDNASNPHGDQSPQGNRRRNNHTKHKKRPPQQRQHESVDELMLDQFTPEEIEAIAESEEIPEPINSKEEKTEPAEKSSVMVEVVGIRFKSSGKTYYFDPSGLALRKGFNVIVDTARGLEYGEVALANTYVSESDIVPPLRSVIRIATNADKQHHLDNRTREQEAFVKCNERIVAHGLDMKLIEAQYTFDNTKLLFYFTSAGRVDFRELVKDLASLFRTRIELRQIGIRDEAKLIGGLGMCGRPLCCSLFLNDFAQVSIKMAKEQNLSLNFTKISGACGRLMCCLRYEHETYEEEIKKTPPVDSTVKTEDGLGVVTEINPLAGTIKVRLNEKPDTPPKTYHRKNVTLIQTKSEKNN